MVVFNIEVSRVEGKKEGERGVFPS